MTCLNHFNLPSWTFFEISLTFVVPPPPRFFHFLSYRAILLILHIHRSCLISATSNLFSCTFFTTHVFATYTSTDLTTVLQTVFPLIFTFIFLSHITPGPLFQFFLLLLVTPIFSIPIWLSTCYNEYQTI